MKNELVSITILRGVDGEIVDRHSGMAFFLSEISKIFRTPIVKKKGLRSAYITPYHQVNKGWVKWDERTTIDKQNEQSSANGNKNRSGRILGAVPYHKFGFILKDFSVDRIQSAGLMDMFSGFGKKSHITQKDSKKKTTKHITEMKTLINKKQKIGGEIVLDSILPKDINGIYFTQKHETHFDRASVFKSNDNPDEFNQIITAFVANEIYKKYSNKDLPIYSINDLSKLDKIKKAELKSKIIQYYLDKNCNYHDEESRKDNCPLEKDLILSHSDVLTNKIISIYNKYKKENKEIPKKIRYAVEVSKIESMNQHYHDILEAEKNRGFTIYSNNENISLLSDQQKPKHKSKNDIYYKDLIKNTAQYLLGSHVFQNLVSNNSNSIGIKKLTNLNVIKAELEDYIKNNPEPAKSSPEQISTNFIDSIKKELKDTKESYTKNKSSTTSRY